MVSFSAKVKIFRVWPRTMDYNKAFRARVKLELILCPLFTPTWKVLQICTILFPLRCAIAWHYFLPKSNFQILAKNHGL